MPDSSPVRYVTVVCHVCGTRLDERQSEQAREVTCPMCHSPATVPAAGTEPPAPPKFKPTEGVEGYSLLTGGAAETREKQKQAANVVLVMCPICQARLHFAPKKESYQATCPDCHEPVRVPAGHEIREKQRRERPTRRPDPVEPLPVMPTQSRTREYAPWYLHAQAHIRREPDAKPPRSLFFSDTFTIPWQREVVSRWVSLAIGLTAIAIVGLVLDSLRRTGGPMGGFALAFFALPLLWIVIWTASYAAAVWLVILIDTANGNREIVNWGDQNWREWFVQLVYVEYLIATTAMFAYGIGYLSRFAGAPQWLATAGTFTTLFPIVVLSALERGGSWNFLSKAVAMSLFRSPLLWLAFLLLSGLIGGGWAAAWWWMFQNWTVAAVAISGVVWSAVVLIHARLLGRLAWGISRDADVDSNV